MPKPPRPIPGWHEPAPKGAPSSPGPDAEYVADDATDAPKGIRLQKVLAAAGVGSRRSCERLIEDGEVAVNGHVVTDLPVWVNPHTDAVTVRGKKIKTAEAPVYIMLFKPRGYICTNSDEDAGHRAIDLVKHPSKVRLYPVGRLDKDSSGLLILTNDGELANRLTHPSFDVHKIYEITVAGSLDDKEVERLQRGLYLTGRRDAGRDKTASRTVGSSLTIIKRDRDRTRLRMELHEGRNRQIRRMMAQLNHPVKKLRRIQMGPLRLRDLQAGQWRELLPKELAALKRVAYKSER